VAILDGPSRDVKRKFDENEVSNESSHIKRLKAVVQQGSPSTLAASSNFEKISGPGRPIGCNRPLEEEELPIVLHDESFAIFRRRSSEPPSKRCWLAAQELSERACKWYSIELRRMAVIQEVIMKHLQLSFNPQRILGTEYTTDGSLDVLVMPAAVMKCKDETEALNEAILDYANFLIKALEDDRRFWKLETRFPCILLVNMGERTLACSVRY
jgi:hypothetical protein